MFVGVDLGTQSCKAVLCDEQLSVIGDHAITYPTSYPAPDRAEQDPRQWDAALEAAVTGAVGPHGPAVRAIAIAGQLDGCIAVDASCTPLHPALIWQDRRAEILGDPARTFAITGQVADASHMAPKLRWLRERVRAARYHQPVSYLVERLTGAFTIDPCHASTTLLYDLSASAWSAELLALYAIDPAELPSIRPTTAIAGVLRAPLASIPAGTPVAVGTGDDFATPLGAGVAAPGLAICAIGTAEVVGALSPAPLFDLPANRSPHDPWRTLSPMVETHAYPTGAFFIENPGWLSGGAVRWATRLLGLTTDAELDALAASVPDSAGITFIPALAGAMTPTWRASTRATLHGLSAGHDRAHVARAILEGLAFASRDVVERLASLGLQVDDILVLGGGSRSAIWTQLRADVLGRTHHVAPRTDTCAIGAAMIAAVSIGTPRDIAAACALAPRPVVAFRPSRSHDEAYSRYRVLSDPSRDV